MMIFAAHPQLAANAEKFHLRLQSVADLPKNAAALKRARIGIYKAYIPSLDEGWTRFLLEQYGFSLKHIENKKLKPATPTPPFPVTTAPTSPRQPTPAP